MHNFKINQKVTNLNLLEGAVNHGDEHVEQHDHHGDVVDSVEHIANVLNEFVPIVDDHGPDLGQSKYSPEQCLEAFLQSGVGERAGQSYFQNSNRPLIIT